MARYPQRPPPAAGTVGEDRISGPDWLAADSGSHSSWGSSSPREPISLAGLADAFGLWEGGMFRNNC